MMVKKFGGASFLLMFAVSGSLLCALEIPLNTVQFPEKKSVDVPFAATSAAAAGAKLEGEVESRGVEARIELSFHNLAPAVLFGGQVNSYVVWAVTRDGNAQNLGELWSRDVNGKARFQTGLKEFAMLVTAEPIPGMARPSDLVVFVSQPVRSKFAKNSAFSYSGFRGSVTHDQQSLGTLQYSGKEPLELYQARRIYEMAQLARIEDYDDRSMSEAKTALAQANNSTRSGGSSRAVADYSRRAVSLVSTAARAMSKAVAEREEAEAAARRRAELNALGQKATEAEQNAAAADAARRRAELDRESATRAQAEAAAAAERMAVDKQTAEQNAAASDAARRQAEEAQSRAEDLRRQAEEQKAAADRAKDEAAQQTAALQEQKNAADRAREESERKAAELETQRGQLAAEKDSLAADRDRVQKDRDALEQRLSGALSGVATTRTTARGIVVSLPGILFATGKATLKPSAQVALAKMAGVLSVFPDMNLRVEGYTDSTGTDAVNDRLSKSRSASVATFLHAQGIASTRIVAEGYGSRLPVAPNTTTAGRTKNRRVEVILAEGVVAAPGR